MRLVLIMLCVALCASCSTSKKTATPIGDSGFSFRTHTGIRSAEIELIHNDSRLAVYGEIGVRYVTDF